jgi:hypothetical protein
MFHSGEDCPAARELADLDRQINLRMKSEAENQRMRDYLEGIMAIAGNPNAIAACRLIIKEAQAALGNGN